MQQNPVNPNNFQNPNFSVQGATINNGVPQGYPSQPPSVVNTAKKNKNPLAPFLVLSLIGLVLAIVAIIVILIFNNQNITKLQGDSQNYLAQIEFQRNQKTQIRDIWDQQAVSNDKLIKSQDNLILQIQSYLEEVNKTIRFIDGKAQLIDTADEKRFKSKLEDLNTELENLNLDSQESIDLKAKNTEIVSELYLKAFEDQNNRANPDGIRN
jgi:ABC-type lipoprotein release transport system permease subunit